MPIKCTFGDVARLREVPGRPGPLSKLAVVESPPASIVDLFRVKRFVTAMAQEIAEYERVLLALGRKYGYPDLPGGSVAPDRLAAFRAEYEDLKYSLVAKHGEPSELPSAALDAFCEAFEEGLAKLVPSAPKPLYAIRPELGKKFEAERTRLDSESRDIISANPLPPSAYEHARLTAADLIALGQLVEEPA